MYAKNAWEKYNDEQIKEIMDFNEGYKTFITKGKTERLCVNETVKKAMAAGYKDLKDVDILKPGDKVYVTNMNKNVALFVIGKKPIEAGLRILGAHIDSPRLDLKQNPLYESEGFALLDTHYYGGVKKYQWVTIPLSLIGVVVKKDGTVINVNIGEDETDPVVGISDLLIHLSADQLKKEAAKVIEGEDLDVTFASMPLRDYEKDSVKANVLKILKEKYDFEEEDFLSAEIEIVPSGKARDYGIDRSMVAGYGHDDRVCAYTSLMAILDINDPEYTSCAILVDKEEIGSVGATGAQSLFFENTISELLAKQGVDSFVKTRKALANSKMLSSDVSAGVDPLYLSVNDKKNAAYLGRGIVFNKYTGARGKSGSNDANPEYMAQIRNILDENNVNYQTAELGKVDQGGGGTIAYILGNYNMNVIDAGVAVLNMHAPMEIVSKVDVYEAYLAYRTFLQKI
ncbi:aminopeptidase [Thomasclavelia cocleata]|uniref:M18 family aminopeptidase n=1 Tax=Thomasclavelia cocleata TaxID=69824 RepID=A0A1I0C5N3_9FIRM|nr:aminopeptidase [Thomasclavelia cocleata]MCR1959590.1 aminopeptidase [Thomasclavelia cocleata]NDO42214.1 aminopeptidase [Thomasclavelia cocleata]PJN81251.1 aminopeptidase [Thomasclavelia cocleata]SET14402.1 Aspartyl aminopeptidase [Thomasclavelia cocleata]